jgi:hypothetical protein
MLRLAWYGHAGMAVSCMTLTVHTLRLAFDSLFDSLFVWVSFPVAPVHAQLLVHVSLRQQGSERVAAALVERRKGRKEGKYAGCVGHEPLHPVCAAFTLCNWTLLVASSRGLVTHAAVPHTWDGVGRSCIWRAWSLARSLSLLAWQFGACLSFV